MRFSVRSVLVAILLAALCINAFRMHSSANSLHQRAVEIAKTTRIIENFYPKDGKMFSALNSLSRKHAARQTQQRVLVRTLDRTFAQYVAELEPMVPVSDRIVVRCVPTVNSAVALPMSMSQTTESWQVYVPDGENVALQTILLGKTRWYRLTTGLNDIQLSSRSTNPSAGLPLQLVIQGNEVQSVTLVAATHKRKSDVSIWNQTAQRDFKSDETLPKLFEVKHESSSFSAQLQRVPAP